MASQQSPAKESKPRRSRGEARHEASSGSTPGHRIALEVPSRFWIVLIVPIVLSSIIAHQLYRWHDSRIWSQVLPHFIQNSSHRWSHSSLPKTESAIDQSVPATLWVKPEAIQLKSTEPGTAPLGKNETLMGAETVVQSPTGIIYTGTADGRFIELFPSAINEADPSSKENWGFHTLARLDRILGIHIVKVGFNSSAQTATEVLVACDATQALVEFELERAWNAAELRWGPAHRITTTAPLLASVDGRPIALCNSIASIENPENKEEIDLVLTDSSKSPLSMLEEELISEVGTGRLILFHYSRFKKSAQARAEDHAVTVLDGIHFANGVQVLGVEGSMVKALVSETLTRSLLEVTFNRRDGSLETYQSAWTGLYHVDNIQPARPRHPVGWEQLPAVVPERASELEDLLFIGVPNLAYAWQISWLPTFRRFSAWIPLPIRISLINPVLYSNSAVGIYSKSRRRFVALLKSKGSELHSTAGGLLLDPRLDRSTGILFGDVVFSSFGPRVPLTKSSLTFQLNQFRPA